MTLSAVSLSAPVTTGTPGLMIPAFSKAIAPSVFPRYSWWSRAMFVMTETSGVTTFVASNRPPIPTSKTAMSTFFSRK